MLAALAWQDHLVIVMYLASMILIGSYAARRQKSSDEYFLASRTLPGWAVGISIMATLMSSLTYLSEPGEVWKSGITNFLGKVIGILLEFGIVIYVFIPFLMRFRFTSAYEYLEHRFDHTARRVGSALFGLLMISWLGFVILSVARSLSQASEIPLGIVIATVGIVATLSTAAGGLRAVVWTEVTQVGLMLCGCLITMGFVIHATGSHVLDWARVSNEYLTQSGESPVRWASLDPFARTSVFTVAMSMFVWSLVTHLGNQMMVQRYFSLSDVRSARLSFIIAQTFQVLIAVLLTGSGLAIVYYYVAGPGHLTVDPKLHADQVFPLFIVQVLPPGLCGAVLAAVMAAAMSMTDSGINALSTVVSVEKRMSAGEIGGEPKREVRSDVRFARMVTLVAGTFITLSAYLLEPLTREGTIVELMPRTFNVFVVPMGGMFLLGMFLPWCNGLGAVTASIVGLVVSFSISYAHLIFGTAKFGFNWVLPSTLIVMFAVATAMRIFGPPAEHSVKGLTWYRRHERPDIDDRLLSHEVISNA